MIEEKYITQAPFEVLQHIYAGVFVLRKDYTIAFWNNCLEEWTGIVQDDILGANLFEHYPHLNTSMYKSRLQNIFKGGPPIVFSSQLHKNIIPSPLPDGQLRKQHTTVTSISPASEDGPFAIFVIEDVTDMIRRIQDYRFLCDKSLEEIKMRKWAEEALREVQAELEERVERRTMELQKSHTENKQLLEAITSVLISIDNKCQVTQWNRVAETTFDIAKADVTGKPLHECGIQWQWDKVNAGVTKCREEKRSVRLDDICFIRPDGSEGFLGITVTPVGSNNGNTDFLLLGADITERKIMEMQLAQAQKLEAIGQLASGIAHEINTPTQYVGDNIRFLKDSFGDILNLLGKYNQILKNVEKENVDNENMSQINQAIEKTDIEYLMEEIPIAIQQSLEGTERITSIVHAMKEFAHPGIKQKMLVDLNQAIASTITVARNEWKYVANLSTDYDSDLSLVSCFPNEFNQVILNLIVNAAHAITDVVEKGLESKGTISISTKKIDDWAEIRITDTGSGIPNAIRPRIFDAFFTTKEVGTGSGQGLAISRSVIVDKHGGELNFETEMGKGTTFIIRLPINPETSCDE